MRSKMSVLRISTMSRSRIGVKRRCLVLALVTLVAASANAQPSKAGGANPAAAANQTATPAATTQTGGTTPSGGGGLQGISYTRDSWNAKLAELPSYKDLGLKKPQDVAKNVVVLCYRLKPGNSAAQPFILEASRALDRVKSCYNVGPSSPLLMNQILAIAIDMTAIPQQTWERFKILNLSIANQQGASLNPTPVRPSLAAATATGTEVSSNLAADLTKPIVPIKPTAEMETLYYVTWPNQMPGDTIPTVSVNLVYTPVAPALPWQAHTFFPAGSIVISDVPDSTGVPTTNGHYYVAVNSGVSSGGAPPFDNARVDVRAYPDGTGLIWQDMGLTGLMPTPAAWQANTLYATGALVVPPGPGNGHYYQAQSPGGTSGPGSGVPAFGITGGVTPDSGFSWQDKGTISFVNPTPQPWTASTAYAQGALVVPPAPGNNHYYQAATAGVTGLNSPPFHTDGTPVTESTGLIWVDSGSTIPAGAGKLKIWVAGAAYLVGDLIQDPSSGHYYSAVQAGISGPSIPRFSVPAPKVVSDDRSSMPVVESTAVTWVDVGPTLPTGAAVKTWMPATVFNVGDVIKATSNDYYSVANAGTSGSSRPSPFPGPGAPAPAAPPPTVITDGLVWVPIGLTLPTGTTLSAWTESTVYSTGAVIQDPISGLYYSALQGGTSGPNPPPFGATITWQDLGTTLPASVSVGMPVTDLTVNLLTYTFPQSHALSTFNLAAGVVVSSIKTRSFTNAGATTTSNGTTWSTAMGGYTVDPILAVTAYVFGPMDAERPFQKKDLIPGITLGFSLTSPSTNFYFGGSSELFIRNIQAVYGLALNRVNTLDPSMQPVAMSQPTTRGIFAKGGFVGLSFNITGFIQSLTGF
jgi:hypothetical protein